MCCGTFTAHGRTAPSGFIGLIGPISLISLPTVSALRNVLCQPQGMYCAFFLNRIAHGARGETSLFPPWAPFSPVCYMEACGTRYTFFKLPRSPRRLRQRGGLNARCHSASQNIFCDVAACAAIPSLGPCALGTHGLAPCVRNCTGIFCRATADLHASGCYPPSGVGNSCFAAASCRFGGGRLSGLRPLEPPVLKQSGSTVTCQRVLPAAEEQGTNSPARKKRELIVCEAISSQ